MTKKNSHKKTSHNRVRIISKFAMANLFVDSRGNVKSSYFSGQSNLKASYFNVAAIDGHYHVYLSDTAPKNLSFEVRDNVVTPNNDAATVTYHQQSPRVYYFSIQDGDVSTPQGFTFSVGVEFEGSHRNDTTTSSKNVSLDDIDNIISYRV